jgi:hypothetical protein
VDLKLEAAEQFAIDKFATVLHGLHGSSSPFVKSERRPMPSWRGMSLLPHAASGACSESASSKLSCLVPTAMP